MSLILAPDIAQASSQKPLNSVSNIEALIQLVEMPQPKNYDKEILEPLREAQAKQAAEEAERARQEEEGRTVWLKSIAVRPQPTGTYYNSYYWHQCTWYVASRLNLPSSLGNAREWLYNLPRNGFQSGPPVPGAIGVTQQGYYGHVVLAEQVDGASVLISEYNYIPYSYGERWVRRTDFSWFY